MISALPVPDALGMCTVRARKSTASICQPTWRQQAMQCLGSSVIKTIGITARLPCPLGSATGTLTCTMDVNGTSIYSGARDSRDMKATKETYETNIPLSNMGGSR